MGSFSKTNKFCFYSKNINQTNLGNVADSDQFFTSFSWQSIERSQCVTFVTVLWAAIDIERESDLNMKEMTKLHMENHARPQSEAETSAMRTQTV